MSFSDLPELTITHLAPLIRRRKISPVELTRLLLARIDRLDSRLNSFITVTPDLALIQAKQAEKEIARGKYRGPLHGIPICLKDLFYTRGVRTTAGSRILRRFIPRDNAAVVDHLFDAGAILLGKTNLHEFAYGATNVNPHFGAVHNPWDAGRMSGGSSGGSAAAVVAGLAVASLGTDTGGSIRIPAAACGCVGLKPGHGRITLRGVIPLAPSLDHVGPICRCVRDAGLLLEVMAGAYPGGSGRISRPKERFCQELGKDVKGLRLGVPRQYFFDRLQPDVQRNTLAAISLLEENGAKIREVNLRHMNETADLAGRITLAEALLYHSKWLQKRADDYGSDLRLRLKEGIQISALAYLSAQKLRADYTRGFQDALQSVDLIVAPTLPVAAPCLAEKDVRIGRDKENVRMALLRLTRPGNLTGLPAISVPCGFTSNGLPTGLQLIGRHMEEKMVLRTAYAYEVMTSWHSKCPPDYE